MDHSEEINKVLTKLRGIKRMLEKREFQPAEHPVEKEAWGNLKNNIDQDEEYWVNVCVDELLQPKEGNNYKASAVEVSIVDALYDLSMELKLIALRLSTRKAGQE